MTARRFYSVSDACRRLGIEPHVLRYWEKEFEFSFKRNSAGRRVVSSQQLKKLELIRHLLHKEGLTVRGARRRLAATLSAPPTSASGSDTRELLLWLKQELLSLRAALEAGD
uniref:MerR family transcriptional regulator n=1 Tax=candidate division WOR-3 bacterium TaxID=2052148 RepID=A0A7C4CBR7_UNCW3